MERKIILELINYSKVYKYLIQGAADQGEPSAQFNLGSLLMANWTHKINYNEEEALKYFTVSAHQGHVGAMYALGIIHLEGHDKFHSCYLAQQLFQNVINRGKNSYLVNSAYYHYLDGNYTTAAILYLEASYLGYEIGYTNSAVLIDKYNLINKAKSFEKYFEESPILTYFSKQISRLESFKNITEMIFDELLEFPRSSENYNITNELNHLVSYSLLKMASLKDNTFALLRLGDYHYYGKVNYGDDYVRAYGFYRKASWTNTSTEFKSQAHMSLGYMHHFGVGTIKSRTKAKQHYNTVSYLTK